MNVLTIGCFDLLHEGHVNLLTKIAERGTPIVVIHDDRSIFALKGRFPVQTASQRVSNLYDSGLVELGNCYRTQATDPSDIVRWLHAQRGIDLFMRGDDMPDFPARKTVEELGIPVSFIAYTEGVSSSLRRGECASR